MPKKKEVSALEIITNYMSYILNNNTKPTSVFSFTKENNITESVFYQYFGSFEAVEKSIFNTFFENTITALEKSKDYQTCTLDWRADQQSSECFSLLDVPYGRD